MKVPEQYRLKNHTILGSNSSYGNNGFFVIPHHRIDNYFYNCQVSDGEGWEHVSVTLSAKKKTVERCCTWEEMCFLKNFFWGEDEVVVQFHPAKSDYVNMHKFCLHMWRPTNQLIPVPDPLMVGIPDSAKLVNKLQKLLNESEPGPPYSMPIPITEPLTNL